MKQLAFNVNETNFEEGVRFSKLILDCFGEEPFDLDILKQTFSELTPEQEKNLNELYFYKRVIGGLYATYNENRRP